MCPLSCREYPFLAKHNFHLYPASCRSRDVSDGEICMPPLVSEQSKWRSRVSNTSCRFLDGPLPRLRGARFHPQPHPSPADALELRGVRRRDMELEELPCAYTAARIASRRIPAIGEAPYPIRQKPQANTWKSIKTPRRKILKSYRDLKTVDHIVGSGGRVKHRRQYSQGSGFKYNHKPAYFT
jgi:hypothetical protein